MKTLLLFASLFCFPDLYAQDTLRIKEIDSLVSIINNSELPTQRDSSFQDYSKMWFTIKTYITQKTWGKQLKKYSRMVKVTRWQYQVITLEYSGSAFYYDDNKLIKVEEFLTKDGEQNKIEWYFSNDNCFYHNSRSVKANDRISFLLNMSNDILKKVTGGN